MAGTVLQLGYTTPLSDAFGAHPTLGSVIDLNDGVTFTLASPDGLEIPAPPRSIVLAGNIRSQGEIATRAITRHNRTVTARLFVGPASSSASLISALRNLLTWLASPPATPITVQYQPFNASAPVYLDVVGAAHNLPSDEGQWLRGQFEPLTITFTCRPGMRGDRLTFQNLAVNAGFEQPCGGVGGGGSVTVFTDTFANANAYASQAGSAPTIASTVLTIPSGARVAFGSPIWRSVALWQVRFKYATSLNPARFYLHYIDANNGLYLFVNASTFAINHKVGGTTTTLATGSISLTNGTFYWLSVTQFPGAPSEVVDIAATLSADSAGAMGSTLATLGPSPTVDGTSVGLSGQPQIEANGASLAIGGNFANVHTVSLFGPGGWTLASVGGTTPASGAWEQTTIAGVQTPTTYSGGPVSSFGAARIDAPPGGTWDSNWRLYSGGIPSGAPGDWAMAVSTPGDTLGIFVWTKSSGMGASATTSLIVREYDASGSFLRNGQAGTTLTGNQTNQSAWTQVGGNYVTGASCAYVDVGCRAADTSAAGASAGAVVWFDNAQVWEVTTTGRTSMPWCDLRAAVSPAMLVVSGLVGDLPAPAFLAVGTYVTSLPTGGALTLYLGRKAVTSPRAQLVNVSYGAYSALFTPQGTAILDSGGYGGCDAVASLGNGSGWNPRFESLLAADAAGVYHLLARIYTEQSGGNIGNITLKAAIAQQTNPWFNQASGSDIVSQWTGGPVTPFAAAASGPNTWTVADAGQCTLPPFPIGALSDPSVLYLTPRAQWQDSSTSNANGRSNWQALLPVDGSLLVATINNPANAGGAVTSKWLWAYADGLLTNRAGASDGPSWTYSLEGGPTANPKAGAGGAGTQASGAVNVNSGADPTLVLDPSQSGANSVAGVNQLVAILSDQEGGVYPCLGEVSYSPLYLEPR